MKNYSLNTDELQARLEFWSAYDHEGQAGYLYCDETDKHFFIAEQVAHFTALLLDMLEENEDDYTFDDLWGFLNSAEIEGVDKLQCPCCDLFFSEDDYMVEDGCCPFCGERMVD